MLICLFIRKYKFNNHFCYLVCYKNDYCCTVENVIIVIVRFCAIYIFDDWVQNPCWMGVALWHFWYLISSVATVCSCIVIILWILSNIDELLYCHDTSKICWILQRTVFVSEWLSHFLRPVGIILIEVHRKGSLIGSWFISRGTFWAKVPFPWILSLICRSVF